MDTGDVTTSDDAVLDLVEEGQVGSSAKIISSLYDEMVIALTTLLPLKLLKETKKHKKLRKTLERKEKIQNRTKILEELKKHQLDPQTYAALSSTSTGASNDRKRKTVDVCPPEMVDVSSNRIVTTGKRQCIKALAESSQKHGDDVIGLDSDSDSESESDLKDEISNAIQVNDEGLKEPTGNSAENSAQEPVQEANEELVETPVEELVESLDEPATAEARNKSVSETSQVTEDDSKKSPNASENAVRMVTRFVPVDRDPLITASRSKLPIIREEQTIMETIRYKDISILCGETGSGKTTQIPQFLYEAGYAIEKKIGITEPRRVAAIAMANRVGHEMNLSSDVVSYQIRFEGNCTDQTKIKFMTDGILLKEIHKDLLLTNYSVIIIDEAHERTVFSDILIGLLSRIVKLRAKKGDPLKLIIMSATLRVDDFISNPNLFRPKPPIIKIESRQFPVSLHFNKITPDDYIAEAYNKTCKIHRNMPKGGGILIFVTGQQEVMTLCQKLRRTFPFNENSIAQQKEKEEAMESKKLSRKENKKLRRGKSKTLEDIMPKIDLDAYGQDVDLEDDGSDGEVNHNNSSEDEDDEDREDVVSCSDPLYVLPLFSHLSEKRQQKIFETPPEGVRLCVVATNIAETSLTIPNIKYVIDSGKVKMKFYDQVTGVSTFLIDWTSKASADQRAGRAGRVGPGHCYRLYSSAIFKDNFKEFSDPEIVRKPVDDLVLQMKAMGIDNVIKFPFPTPPAAENVAAAEKRLVLLGALKELKVTHPKNRNNPKARLQKIRRITPQGRIMSYFPLSPRFAKMIVLASQHNLTSYAVSIVSALTVQEVFISQSCTGPGDEDGTRRIYKDKLVMIRKRWAGTGNSLLLGDMMIFLCAIGAWEHVDCAPVFCSKFGLRLKAMTEIRKLRQQLTNEIATVFPQLDLPGDLKMVPPTDNQAKCLRQVLLSGLFDHIARKMPDEDKPEEQRKRLRNAYKSVELDAPVFISLDSVLHGISPEWVVYHEIYETQKLYMRYVLAIQPSWIPIYAPNMCTFSKPLDDPTPRYDPDFDCIKCTVTCTFGPHQWPLPDTEIEYPESIDKYRWFVRCLLEGDVIDYFKSKRSLLLSSPSIMLKSWSKLQKRTEVILTCLAHDRIASNQGLMNRWKEDPKYLYNEFCLWIPETYHYDVQSEWPPIPKSVE